MHNLLLIFFICLTTSFICCDGIEKNKPKKNHFEKAKIPSLTVDVNQLYFNQQNSNWYIGDSIFSGFAIRKYLNGQLQEKFGILDGKKQNYAREWFSNGQLKSISFFQQGSLHGEKKIWSLDSGYVLIAHYNYSEGKADGLQHKWYNTGELYQELNIENGIEKGRQKAYRKNGDLYANYEAINGRFFGLMRSKLCVQLENQNIKVDE